MKKIDVMNIIKNKKFVAGCAAIAVAAVVATVSFNVNRGPEIPWPETTEENEADIVPLSPVVLKPDGTPLSDKPVTTTKTKKSTKTSKKTVTLKTASTRTYTKNLGTKTTKDSKIEKEGNTTTKTDTTVATNTVEKYTKKSKKKIVTTKVTTTIKTTTTVEPAAASGGAQDGGNATETQQSTASSSSNQVSELNVRSLAPLMPTNVLDAYESLGFKVVVNPSVSYAGYFNAKDQSITLKAANDTIYHELGHFIAFIAGNVDTTSNFKTVYGNEKNAFPGVNKTYACQSPSEFFAESMRVFILQKAQLKSACPNTSAALDAAINKITDSQVAYVKKIYGGYWK